MAKNIRGVKVIHFERPEDGEIEMGHVKKRENVRYCKSEDNLKKNYRKSPHKLITVVAVTPHKINTASYYGESIENTVDIPLAPESDCFCYRVKMIEPVYVRVKDE